MGGKRGVAAMSAETAEPDASGGAEEEAMPVSMPPLPPRYRSRVGDRQAWDQLVALHDRVVVQASEPRLCQVNIGRGDMSPRARGVQRCPRRARRRRGHRVRHHVERHRDGVAESGADRGRADHRSCHRDRDRATPRTRQPRLHEVAVYSSATARTNLLLLRSMMRKLGAASAGKRLRRWPSRLGSKRKNWRRPRWLPRNVRRRVSVSAR